MKYNETTFNLHAPEDLLTDARDLLAALAGEAGYETFEETPTGLKGYIQHTLYNKEALDEALRDFPFDNVTIGYDTHEAEDRDWNEAWEQEGFEPICIGNGLCTIHDGRHLPDREAQVEVQIDAHMAFGTGNHETTRMAVAALLAAQPRGKGVIDAGCGTGILGIAALKAGAARALGYDVDEWSADNARHNAALNGIDPDRYEARLGDATTLDTVAWKADIVVANIFRDILIADMPRLARALAPGGTLILSGFYEADAPTIAQAAQAQGLTQHGISTDNGWACLTLGNDKH